MRAEPTPKPDVGEGQLLAGYGLPRSTIGHAFCRAISLDARTAVGWNVITQRARRSVQPLPADAVLAGLSMGVGVLGTLLPERGQTAGVLMLHALADHASELTWQRIADFLRSLPH
jgi:hypothetical protein